MKNGFNYYYVLAYSYLFLWFGTIALCSVPFLVLAYVEGVGNPQPDENWPWWSLPFLAAFGCAAYFIRKVAGWNIRRMKALKADNASD